MLQAKQGEKAEVQKASPCHGIAYVWLLQAACVQAAYVLLLQAAYVLLQQFACVLLATGKAEGGGRGAEAG